MIPSPNEKPSGLGYVRVSTDRQETDRQICAVRRWMAAAGVDCLSVIEENESVSGRADVVKRANRLSADEKPGRREFLVGQALRYYSDLAAERFECLERSGFSRLFREIVSSRDHGGGVPVSVVAFYAIDRASRDTLELLLLEKILARYDVTLVCVSEGGVVDTASAAGKFMFRVLAAKAEFECDQTSERTGASLRRMVERGDKVGRPPVGWRMAKDAEGRPLGFFEHDPATWPKVERVHNLRYETAGLCTYQTISQATGIPVSSIKAHLDAWAWVPPGPPPAPVGNPEPALALEPAPEGGVA